MSDTLFGTHSIPEYNMPVFREYKRPTKSTRVKIQKLKARKVKTPTVHKKRKLTPQQQQYVAQQITDKVAMNKLRYMITLD